ncbi:virulence RhuM family protein, partial [uncultured Duncaniella sp.]
MAKEIQFILYNLPDNSGTVQAIVQDETIFLTQKAMAELFGVEVNTINYHLKEIFSIGELIEEATIRKIRTVQTEGNRQVERERAFYNLDAIISVGYRVNSQRATLFRQWATRVLN